MVNILLIDNSQWNTKKRTKYNFLEVKLQINFSIGIGNVFPKSFSVDKKNLRQML